MFIISVSNTYSSKYYYVNVKIKNQTQNFLNIISRFTNRTHLEKSRTLIYYTKKINK